MAARRRPLNRNEFEVAIICALQVEFDAVDALIEDNWESEKSYGKVRGDPNAYRIGSIGEHNVVVATLPEMGRRSSATAAAWLSASFPNIRLGLVVGICGAVPWNPVSSEHITLGDITISTGLVQYDYGRQYPDGVRRKDLLENNLARPTTEIRSFLRILESRKSKRLMLKRTALFLDHMFKESEFEPWRYPGLAQDKLYDQNYRHKHQDPSVCQICAQCRTDADPVCESFEIMDDPNGVTFQPALHFGRIASGDLVMKSASHRDHVASKERVIAFEMEGAGVWEAFPTVVIKSVCDYADSHKNKAWQQFAAATAAACTKAFLNEWRTEDTPQHLSALNIDAGQTNAAGSGSGTGHLPSSSNKDQVSRQGSENLNVTNSGAATVQNSDKLGKKLFKGLSLFEAARTGTPGFAESLTRSDTTLRDEKGWTLMHFAAKGNQIALVDRLYLLGLDVAVEDFEGATPMYNAAARGHIGMVDHLRSLGASVQAKKKSGWTPIHAAAKFEEVAMVDHLLSLGYDIDVKDNEGFTPILTAAARGGTAMIEYLKSRGANLEVSTVNGSTLMGLAVKNGHVKTFDKLLSLRQKVDGKDKSGRTLIFLAAQKGHIAMVDRLYSLGHDINVKDNNGTTPLQAAEKAGKNEMVRHLRRLGTKRTSFFKKLSP